MAAIKSSIGRAIPKKGVESRVTGFSNSSSNVQLKPRLVTQKTSLERPQMDDMFKIYRRPMTKQQSTNTTKKPSPKSSLKSPVVA